MNADKPSYFLDPDYRRDAPRHNSYCVRCQKGLKRGAKIVRVTVNWKTMQVTEGGKDLMGADCWRAISMPGVTLKNHYSSTT